MIESAPARGRERVADPPPVCRLGFTDYRNPDLIDRPVKKLRRPSEVYGLALGYEDLHVHRAELRNDPLLAERWLRQDEQPIMNALSPKAYLEPSVSDRGDGSVAKDRYHEDRNGLVDP